MIDEADTHDSTPPDLSGQAFLDVVFERAVRLVEDGLVPDVDALIAGHESLRAEVERLVQLAQSVAVGRPEPLPVISGFTLLQPLGRGGMGTVYLARQHSLGGRPVALKVLPGGVALSTRARARFLAEAAAIARLRHPNIVAVHDVVHQDELYAYAMEWVDGSSLAEVIAGEGMEAPRHEDAKGLVIGETCRIGIAIARALEAVHAAGLLHRDVKPSNILLRRDGTPLLADFGLARELDSSVHTQAGHFAGTVAYAPPEQLRGDSPSPPGRGQGEGGVDARSDIYALGVTLYHALALQLPFEARNPAAMLRRIEAGAATPLRKVNPRVPRDLETIVAKAMEVDPARRYQTAADLADDLERFTKSLPIHARRAGPVTRTIKLVRRNRAAAFGMAFGGLVALGLAAALVAYVFFLPGWVAGHVREARLTLLDPGQANNIVSTMYWGRINPGGDAHWEARRQVLQQALIHYDRALRLASRDESIRREREVVSRAQQMTTEPRILNPANGPSGNHGPRRPMPTSVSSVAPLPGSLSASALRDDGLFAFLTHDYPTAIEKWSAWEQTRDPLLEPDPLVDAALGVLYLFDDQPGRAYPRLQKAAEAFPGVGFILEYLADAAVKCGDVERAERWLQEAQRLRTSAGGGANNRIRAAILARQGRDDEAEAIYQSAKTPGPVILEHARFLESRGRMDEALEQYSRAAAGMSGDRPAREFVNAADRWWTALPQSARLQRIRSTCDSGQASLIPLLRQYQAAVLREQSQSRTRSDAGRGRCEAGFQIFNLKYQVVAALCAWLSSPSLESLSLNELAERMEVENMSLWNRIGTYPSWIRQLRAFAWIMPWLSRASDSILRMSPANHLRKALVVSTGLVMTAATVSAEELTCPGFESCSLVVDLPNVSDTWGGDVATITGSTLGVNPASGSNMLRFHYTLPASEPCASCGGASGSEVYQLIDLAPYASLVASGLATAQAQMKVNRIAGDAQTDSNFGIDIRAYSGALGSFPLNLDNQIASQVTELLSDSDVVSWETVAVTLPIPTNATYLALRIYAHENVFNDNGSGVTEFDGHFADDVSLIIPLPCTTPPCFQGLGDLPGGIYESSAGGIAACPLSSDGTTVVGSSISQDGPQAFRWTPQTGMVGLGDLPGGGFASFARTVNANGLIVGGGSNSSNSSNSPPHEAFSWDSSNGMIGLGVPAPFTTTYMNGMSDDGNIQVGGEPAWYRIGAGPILPLASPGGSHWNAYAISRTGSHAVGGNFTGSEWTAIRWSISGGFDSLGDLSGGATNARAWAVSADGAIVVGYGTSAAGTEAFRWTQATGMVALGDLPGGATSSSASAISANGSIIVGSGTDGSGSRAVAWIDSVPAAPVSDLLSDNGISIPAGWVLTNASGVTTNGNIVTICGNGTNPSGNPEAWIARYTLPPACDPADVVQSPDAATAPFGGSVQFQVMAGGTGPLTYQWRKDNVPLTDGPVGCGGSISGATTDTLVLNTVTFVEGGNYDCVVTNACGTDTSAAATLTINPPPAAADVNHDGQVNGADIQALVNALLAP